MTRLERTRSAGTIPAAFHGAGRVARSLELLQGHAGGTLAFKPNVWKAAKPQLKQESGGTCAYCESPTDTVAHGDVEHFRPKSIYWWLAYCYDNYVFACQICNQVFKVDAFPVHAAGGRWAGPVLPEPPSPESLARLAETLVPDAVEGTAGPVGTEFLKVAAREKPGLVDPYVVDADPLFKWVADDTLKEVEVRAASTRVGSRRAFAAVTQFCGLNREELKRWRWRTYHELVVLSDALRAFERAGIEPGLQGRIREQIRAMTRPGAPYAGMVRYFVRALDIAL